MKMPLEATLKKISERVGADEEEEQKIRKRKKIITVNIEKGGENIKEDKEANTSKEEENKSKQALNQNKKRETRLKLTSISLLFPGIKTH
jgi:hypothetical protein